MIEDDQNVRDIMKRSQQFHQARRGGFAGVGSQIVHDQMRLALRQIVNAQMKHGAVEWNAPLDRKRNLNRVRKLAQRGGRADAVMIGQRNETQQFEVDFDLIALQFKGLLRRQRRRPVRLRKIDRPDGFLALFFQSPAQQRPFFSKRRDENKALFGLIRMTVKGNSRPVFSGSLGLLPKA